jgi:hypothetical protein
MPRNHLLIGEWIQIALDSHEGIYPMAGSGKTLAISYLAGIE